MWWVILFPLLVVYLSVAGVLLLVYFSVWFLWALFDASVEFLRGPERP